MKYYKEDIFMQIKASSTKNFEIHLDRNFEMYLDRNFKIDLPNDRLSPMYVMAL